MRNSGISKAHLLGAYLYFVSLPRSGSKSFHTHCSWVQHMGSHYKDETAPTPAQAHCSRFFCFVMIWYPINLTHTWGLMVWLTYKYYFKPHYWGPLPYVGHDDVIKWKHFRVIGPLCVEFTRHRWIPTQMPVPQSFDVFFKLHLKQPWANNGDAGDLRCHRAHYDIM